MGWGLVGEGGGEVWSRDSLPFFAAADGLEGASCFAVLEDAFDGFYVFGVEGFDAFGGDDFGVVATGGVGIDKGGY